MEAKQPCVCMLASRRNGTIYVGVTSDLVKRGYQYRNDVIPGFSQKYNVHDLVWYELHTEMVVAILRETRIKKWSRAAKRRLIETSNATWRDLWPELAQPSVATGFRHSLPERRNGGVATLRKAYN